MVREPVPGAVQNPVEQSLEERREVVAPSAEQELPAAQPVEEQHLAALLDDPPRPEALREVAVLPADPLVVAAFAAETLELRPAGLHILLVDPSADQEEVAETAEVVLAARNQEASLLQVVLAGEEEPEDPADRELVRPEGRREHLP